MASPRPGEEADGQTGRRHDWLQAKGPDAMHHVPNLQRNQMVQSAVCSSRLEQ